MVELLHENRNIINSMFFQKSSRLSTVWIYKSFNIYNAANGYCSTK